MVAIPGVTRIDRLELLKGSMLKSAHIMEVDPLGVASVCLVVQKESLEQMSRDDRERTIALIQDWLDSIPIQP